LRSFGGWTIAYSMSTVLRRCVSRKLHASDTSPVIWTIPRWMASTSVVDAGVSSRFSVENHFASRSNDACQCPSVSERTLSVP
jgi:hypothetical protein